MKSTPTNRVMNYTRMGVRRLPVPAALVAITTLALLCHPFVGSAAILRLGEPFNYAAGDLDGRGTDDTFGDFSNWGNNFQFLGSQWTSDWTLDEGSSLDFKVVSNALTLDDISGIGPDDQGNYSATISRGLSLGSPRGSWTFSGTFTAIGDPIDNYMATMGFGDAARMGIQDGQFVVQLGDQQPVNAGQVLPNTPYTVVAEIEFGVPVNVGGAAQTGERMTVWVNETYRRMNERTAVPQFVVESATGMTDLGDMFSLVAQSGSDSVGNFTNATWDDLFIGTYYQEVNGFRHDISPHGANVQEGFISWDASVDGLVKSFPRADTGYGDVTFTIGGNNVVAVDAGGVGSVADDLLRDGVKAEGELTLSLEGLDPGDPPEGDPYILKAYLHNPASQLVPIDVFLEVDGEEQLVMTVTPSLENFVGTHASIAFSALDEYANFRFVPWDGGDIWLNGFELVPEPNSSLMMLLGLVGFAKARLRHRKSRS